MRQTPPQTRSGYTQRRPARRSSGCGRRQPAQQRPTSSNSPHLGPGDSHGPGWAAARRTGALQGAMAFGLGQELRQEPAHPLVMVPCLWQAAHWGFIAPDPFGLSTFALTPAAVLPSHAHSHLCDSPVAAAVVAWGSATWGP